MRKDKFSYTEKRTKFAEEIRKKQKQRIIKFQREANDGEVPLLAYVPPLLQEQAYEELQEILDGIIVDQYLPLKTSQNSQQEKQSSFQEHPLSSEVIKSILQRQKNHTQDKIRLLMLKLMNRLGLWGEQEFQKCLLYIKTCESLNPDCPQFGRYESMIKEMAIFLERRKSKHQESYNLKWSKQIIKAFEAIKHHLIIDQQNRIFWMDIVNEALTSQASNPNTQVYNIHLTSPFFKNIDIVVSHENEFLFSRFINIIELLIVKNEGNQNAANIAEGTVKLRCYSQFLTLLTSGSIDLVIQGLSLLAQIYSASDSAIKQSIFNFNTNQIHLFYLDHVLGEVRINNYWGISNILGSEYSEALTGNKNFIKQLEDKFFNETIPKLQVEIYTCFLNIWCVFGQREYVQIMEDEQKCKKFMQMLEKVSEILINHEQELMDRYLFAIYNLSVYLKQNQQSHLSTYSYMLTKLHELKKILLQIYYGNKQGSKESEIVEKIDVTLKQLDELFGDCFH